jgi:hypothetical protein
MFQVGQKLFIRTITFHMLGEVAEIEGDWVKLTGASWVADSGRFGTAIATGKLSEVEYVGEAYVNLSTATDILPWAHELPTTSV